MTRRRFEHGQPIVVEGSCGDEQGSVRGLRGQVYGDNHTTRGEDGIERTHCRLENGDYVAVPTKALRGKQ